MTTEPATGGVRASGTATPVAAVCFDRDGTLVVDVPYNGDPDAVRPMPGALEAVAAVRAAGLPIAVVTNQSGIARGIVTAGQVAAVNARVDELFGGFDAWCVCPHGPDDGCDCRKPRPGLVLQAAARLGVPAAAIGLIGDIGSDLGAAAAAGARGVLVPSPATRPQDLAAAGTVAASLPEAVALLLGAAP